MQVLEPSFVLSVFMLHDDDDDGDTVIPVILLSHDIVGGTAAAAVADATVVFGLLVSRAQHSSCDFDGSTKSGTRQIKKNNSVRHFVWLMHAL